MRKIYGIRLYSVFALLLTISSCRGDQRTSAGMSQESIPSITLPTDTVTNFSTLKFELEGQPCIALIDKKYVQFDNKQDFPLSFFIQVATVDADSLGHPTPAEAMKFNSLKDKIISELQTGIGPFQLVGITVMPHYRDILLYIKQEDQQKASTVLMSLKLKNPGIKSFGFEIDPKWEAVESFLEAIKSKN